jgi:hypothetical protein
MAMLKGFLRTGDEIGMAFSQIIKDMYPDSSKKRLGGRVSSKTANLRQMLLHIPFSYSMFFTCPFFVLLLLVLPGRRDIPEVGWLRCQKFLLGP